MEAMNQDPTALGVSTHLQIRLSAKAYAER